MMTGKQPMILVTKLVRPWWAARLVDRSRVLDLIAMVEEKRVTVLTAGAGFGKTSVAAAWAERLEQSGNSVAWLTLDAGDDEPMRFFYCLSQALRRACGGVGEAAINLILDISLASPMTIVATLINELADVDRGIYLFLDDYHWITHRGIHELLSHFLNYAPSQFHLVLATRIEPALPLARLRAQNQLLEIDASILRFDLEETRHFLEHEKIGRLNPTDLKILHAKTEGWPAVLRIVASTAAHSGQPFAQYVRRLSGALRPIGAYLVEMLDALPPDMVQFMLRTAILDRLCAPLCQAVTGVKSSRNLLESMEARQPLLTPLDHERRWYRYHPLLVQHLSRRLESEFGDEIPGLHRRASQWYASNELWTDAVQHAIAAGDSKQAMNWIEKCAMALVKTGDLLTLLGWLRLFPTQFMESQIKVRLAIAWGMALAMRFAECLELLEEIEHRIAHEDAVDGEAFRCESRTIRSVVLAMKDDSRAALSLAAPCVTQATDAWTANVASNVVRFCHWKSGDLKSLYATPWIPYSLDEERRSVFSSVYRLCLQGLVEFQQVRLSIAERHYLEAMRLAEEHVGPSSVAAALPASLIARIRYEQGRLDEAEALVVDRVTTINATGMLECALSAYLVLVRVAAHCMHIERAYALLERAENLGYTRQWGRLIAAVLALRLRLYLAEGRVMEAAACVDRIDRLAAEYPAPTRCAWSDIHRYAALARADLASAQSRLPDAVSILKRLHQEAEAAHNPYVALGLGTRISAVLCGAGESAESADAFRRVLGVAAPAGIHQTILDQGPEIGRLLLNFRDGAQRSMDSSELLPYVDRLIDRWHELHQSQPGARSPAGAETLSPRERNILELIGRGRSNKEIARNLGIAPETVKSHVKHILVKLGADTRAQAVSRAQSLGLVGR